LGVDRVDLIGQSWGCQVARYYLRFGGADVLGESPETPRPGADAVRTAFLIGPPSGGTVYAYHDLLLGFAPTGKLGKRFTPREIGLWPCAYQMLRLGSQLVVDEHGKATDLDPADLSFWRRFGLGQCASPEPGESDPDQKAVDAFIEGQLIRSTRLAAALSPRNSPEAGTQLVTYTSDSIPTLTRIVLSERGGTTRPVLDAHEVASRHPDAARAAIEMGDEYVPFRQVRELSPETNVVRDPRHVSDQSSILLVHARRHRWLVRSHAVLSNILLNAGG
jgi:pimeloyl-ACP methyl ester carboxylesterase